MPRKKKTDQLTQPMQLDDSPAAAKPKRGRNKLPLRYSPWTIDPQGQELYDAAVKGKLYPGQSLAADGATMPKLTGQNTPPFKVTELRAVNSAIIALTDACSSWLSQAAAADPAQTASLVWCSQLPSFQSFDRYYQQHRDILPFSVMLSVYANRYGEVDGDFWPKYVAALKPDRPWHYLVYYSATYLLISPKAFYLPTGPTTHRLSWPAAEASQVRYHLLLPTLSTDFN